MISDLLFGATILIGVGGLALLIDLARVRIAGSESISDPEREQLVVALAMVAFAGLFFLGRGSGDGSSAEPVPADPQPALAQGGDDASLARLAVAARLPSLRPRERPRKPSAEKPSRAPSKPSESSPAVDYVPVSPPEDVEPPAPVPAPEPAPAPEPDPAPPVGFDDSG